MRVSTTMPLISVQVLSPASLDNRHIRQMTGQYALGAKNPPDFFALRRLRASMWRRRSSVYVGLCRASHRDQMGRFVRGHGLKWNILTPLTPSILNCVAAPLCSSSHCELHISVLCSLCLYACAYVHARGANWWMLLLVSTGTCRDKRGRVWNI